MLKFLRSRLRKISFLHNQYMRLKRRYTGEILGMTTKSEQDYFAVYGEYKFQGKGEIVDLGCWLGSTTIPLVKGLLKNDLFIANKRKICVYDTFVWYDVMAESVAGTDLVGKFSNGDSFLDEYKRRTADFSEYIEIRAGDLCEIGWQDGEIEFLLVDAMKNWELANSILKNFYSQLIPNQSLVLQQDFAHYFTSWIHLIHWKLRDYFEFVEDIPGSSSVVYRNTKKIPDELLSPEYSFAGFTLEEIEKAFDYSLSLVCEEKKPNIYAAKVMTYIHQNKFEDAEKELENVKNKGVNFEKDLFVVETLIRERY